MKTEHLGNGRVKFSWDTPTDDFATNLGYVIRIGTTPGGNELTNSESDSTGRRLITKPAPVYTNFFETQLDPGIYYWSVQAVDPGLKGGEFSDEQQYILTYDWKILNQGGIIDRRIQGVKDPVIKLADLDNDGDMDLIYTSASSNVMTMTPTQLFKYDGKRLVPIEGNNPLSYVSSISDAEVGDVNGDGTSDILVNNYSSNGSYNLKLFLSDSSGYHQSDIGSGLYKAKGKIIDLNNDGRDEIILLGLSSNQASGTLRFYVYDLDTASNGFILHDLTSQIASLSEASFDLGDIDSDQDFDVIISGFSPAYGNKSYIYKNVTPLGGDYQFEQTDNNIAAVTDGTCSLIDFDGDGDLDALITGSTADAGDVFEIYMNKINEGGTAWPRLNNIGLTPMYDSKVDLGDFNGDGYSDLLYSGMVQGEGAVTKLSEYDPVSQAYKPSSFDVSDIINAEVEFGDIEGDGDLDFSISGENRAQLGTYIFRTYVNVRNQSAEVLAEAAAIQSPTGPIDNLKQILASKAQYTVNKPPSVPIVNSVKILDSLIGDKPGIPVEFSWQSATDDHTPVKGLTYALKVGTTPGGDDIMSANANSNGIRKTAEKGNAEHNLKWRIRVPKGTYYWSVQAVDASFAGSKFSEPQQFITSANNAPTNIELSNGSIDENKIKGSLVGKLSSTDPDAGDPHTYSLISGDGDNDNSSFTISGDSLLSNAMFNYEQKSSYSVRIQTKDSGGKTFDKSFVVQVNNVNEAPINIALSRDSINENQAIGTLVGLFTSTDPDSGDPHTYSLISGEGDSDNNSFAISGDSLLTAKVFDYVNQNTYSIRVQTMDSSNNTFSKNFVIFVGETTGIILNEYHIRLFPNPFQNKRITVEVPFDDQFYLRVTDISGRVLFNKKLDQKMNTVVFENITRGVYIVHVVKSNKVVFSSKIIAE